MTQSLYKAYTVSTILYDVTILIKVDKNMTIRTTKLL